MKNIVTGAVIVGAMLAAGSVAADMGDMKPYVGADYYHVMMKGKGSKDVPGVGNADFTKALPKSYPGASIYAGVKFMENFGAELGANFSKKKDASVTVGANTFKNEVKRNGGHLDLIGFWPLNDGVNLIGSLGAGMAKPKFTTTRNNVGVPVSSKSEMFARIGAGANYMLTDMFGLRGKINWENTSRLKANFNNGGEIKPFKDTVSFTVGAFAQF